MNTVPAHVPDDAEERVDYDEFAYFHENAAEFGLPYDGPPVVRRLSVALGDGRAISALRWGESAPELVLVHGGAQNAHTWDTVALALGPLLAVDLAGHGHSDDVRRDPARCRCPNDMRSISPTSSSRSPPMRSPWWACRSAGLSSIALATHAPELVRRLALVDITPGVSGDKAKAIIDFVSGPATFDRFDDLLARTIEFNPTRSESSLRRGILHNARAARPRLVGCGATAATTIRRLPTSTPRRRWPTISGRHGISTCGMRSVRSPPT
ncbi:MAG: alpha/beta hydrolase [Actinomycetota bacterium]|nr:alpha/beta hydrolase [Actinomycetota bacterium]